VVDRDIDDLLRGPVFEPIRSDEATFRRVRVRRGTIVWPGGIDIDPHVLIWGGPASADGRPCSATMGARSGWAAPAGVAA
jgi:Protein of unknown function (DUF2442)